MCSKELSCNGGTSNLLQMFEGIQCCDNEGLKVTSFSPSGLPNSLGWLLLKWDVFSTGTDRPGHNPSCIAEPALVLHHTLHSASVCMCVCVCVFTLTCVHVHMFLFDYNHP